MHKEKIPPSSTESTSSATLPIGSEAGALLNNEISVKRPERRSTCYNLIDLVPQQGKVHLILQGVIKILRGGSESFWTPEREALKAILRWEGGS